MSKLVRFPSRNNEAIEYLEDVIQKLKENKIEDLFCGCLEKSDKEELPLGDAIMISNDSFRLMGLLFSSLIDIYVDIKLQNNEEMDE